MINILIKNKLIKNKLKLKYFIYLIPLFFSNTNSFNLPDFPNLHNLHNLPKIQNLNNIPLANNKFELNKFKSLLNEEDKIKIIQTATGILPKLDFISKSVLEFNEYVINNIITNNILELETKKKLIIFMIKFTQTGDNTGSEILKQYLKLVQNLL